MKPLAALESNSSDSTVFGIKMNSSVIFLSTSNLRELPGPPRCRSPVGELGRPGRKWRARRRRRIGGGKRRRRRRSAVSVSVAGRWRWLGSERDAAAKVFPGSPKTSSKLRNFELPRLKTLASAEVALNSSVSLTNTGGSWADLVSPD